MSGPSFSPILDKQPSAIERPKPIPVGSYLAVIQGQPKLDKSTKKQTPYVEFTMKFLQAQDDVDADDLAHALTKPSGEKKALTDVTMRNTFYLTEDAAWRLKQFLVRDLKMEDDNRSLAQMIAETAGMQVIVVVKHRASDDGETTFAEIGATAAAE